VLFADVSGSMELAEQVDPEEWHRILNRFFEILTDGVHRFEGTVNQYTGDGIMALFGAPIAHEDHAHRACYAALHLQGELRKYADELRRTKALNFSVRMGLNSGEVVVGKIGNDLRMDYTAQGQTVGLAARLEQLAEAGKAYVSEPTADLVSGFFALRDLGQFDLKGAGEPQRVFELQGVGEMRTRLDVSRARGLSRFVGRAAEMESLERALARSVEGNAQVVGIVAEPGVGKSRLCFEFLEKCRARGLRVRETAGVAHGKSIPFLPVLDLLRGFFGVTMRDTDEEARRKIAGTLLLLDRDLTEMLPILFDFLGVPDPKNPSPRMDPEARQRQLFQLSGRILHVRSREQPGVLLVEDLHWLDGGTEAFLEHLVEALPGARSLLLLDFRPEYHAAWMQKSYYEQLPLHPLGRAELDELLAHLLGNDASLAGLADRIRERTAGNPFFVEEVVRALVESGALEGARGAYRLVRAVKEAAIPASVQALLASRIDRLPEREKHVLQAASVIGKEFGEALLREVADLPEQDLAAALRALSSAEFIYESALYPEIEHAFKHPLTQEVAYRSQLADRRTRTHAALARAIESLHPGRLDEQAALIAQHWENAGERLEAARWHTRAAEWAGLREQEESLRHWQAVRSLLAGMDETPETMGLGLMARIQLLNLAWRLGAPDEDTERVYEEGLALARRIGNRHAEMMLGGLRTTIVVLAGDPARALRMNDEALPLLEDLGDPGALLAALNGRGFILLQMGPLAESVAAYEKVIELGKDNPKLGADVFGVSPYAFAHVFRANALIFMGRLRIALQGLDRGLALAEELGETEVAGWAHGIYAILGLYLGGGPEGLAHARRALEIAEKTGTTLSRVSALTMLGAAHAGTGQWREARDLYEEAISLARERRAALSEVAYIQGRLADACLELGQEGPAREAAEAAVAFYRDHPLWTLEPGAQLALARVLIRTEGADAREQIEAALARVETLVEETGARMWLPFLHERRADLARALGDEAGRERELREAHRLFAEIGAEGHAARLARELAM